MNYDNHSLTPRRTKAEYQPMSNDNNNVFLISMILLSCNAAHCICKIGTPMHTWTFMHFIIYYS